MICLLFDAQCVAKLTLRAAFFATLLCSSLTVQSAHAPTPFQHQTASAWNEAGLSSAALVPHTLLAQEATAQYPPTTSPASTPLPHTAAASRPDIHRRSLRQVGTSGAALVVPYPEVLRGDLVLDVTLEVPSDDSPSICLVIEQNLSQVLLLSFSFAPGPLESEPLSISSVGSSQSNISLVHVCDLPTTEGDYSLVGLLTDTQAARSNFIVHVSVDVDGGSGKGTSFGSLHGAAAIATWIVLWCFIGSGCCSFAYVLVLNLSKAPDAPQATFRNPKTTRIPVAGRPRNPTKVAPGITDPSTGGRMSMIANLVSRKSWLRGSQLLFSNTGQLPKMEIGESDGEHGGRAFFLGRTSRIGSEDGSAAGSSLQGFTKTPPTQTPSPLPSDDEGDRPHSSPQESLDSVIDNWRRSEASAHQIEAISESDHRVPDLYPSPDIPRLGQGSPVGLGQRAESAGSGGGGGGEDPPAPSPASQEGLPGTPLEPHQEEHAVEQGKSRHEMNIAEIQAFAENSTATEIESFVGTVDGSSPYEHSKSRHEPLPRLVKTPESGESAANPNANDVLVSSRPHSPEADNADQNRSGQPTGEALIEAIIEGRSSLSSLR